MPQDDEGPGEAIEFLKSLRELRAERDRYKTALATIVGECANMDEAVMVAKKALGDDTV